VGSGRRLTSLAMGLVEGVVVSRGAPVAGAVVRAIAALGDPVVATHSDDAGRFLLKLPKVQGGWTIDATFGERLWGASWVRPRETAALIELFDAALVRVRVVAASGEPVEGARVDLRSADWDHEMIFYGSVCRDRPDHLGHCGLRTDARGEVTGRIAEARRYFVLATHAELGEGYENVQLDAVDRDTPIELVLQRPVEPRKPEPPALVDEPDLASEPRSPSPWAAQLAELRAGLRSWTTIVRIEFEGAPRPPGFAVLASRAQSFRGSRRRVAIRASEVRWLDVLIFAPGFARHSMRLMPSDTLQRVTVTLGRGERVHGRIVDRTTGGPVSGATVDIASIKSDFGAGWAGTCVSDAEGRFALVGARPGPVCLSVSAPGFATEIVGSPHGAGTTPSS
jgi:hypothetical protein